MSGANGDAAVMTTLEMATAAALRRGATAPITIDAAAHTSRLRAARLHVNQEDLGTHHRSCSTEGDFSNLVGAPVDLAAGGHELSRLLLHSQLDGDVSAHAVGFGVVTNVLADAHRAELRPAHGAEVRRLGGL